MKVLVTGVAGQLGHDVMNELAKRGYDGIGTDIADSYSGVQDNTAVVGMSYVQLDITDAESVEKTIKEIKPDVVVHCAAWTAVDAAEDDENRDKVLLSMLRVQRILPMPAKRLMRKWYILQPIMYLTDREQSLGNLIAKNMLRSIFTDSQSLMVNLR